MCSVCIKVTWNFFQALISQLTETINYVFELKLTYSEFDGWKSLVSADKAIKNTTQVSCARGLQKISVLSAVRQDQKVLGAGDWKKACTQGGGPEKSQDHRREVSAFIIFLGTF